ncbi:MAG: Gfo/Idh/MocA family oxidoreductase [Gemmatimonadota bacterium]|nr:Gfo/Idh/MocA family oxidoreductase [Gemmatimonadota bacterium]
MNSAAAIAPVRWGILGTANIALRAVIPGMQRSPLARVVAIASRNLSSAQNAAAALNIDRAYGSYDELLNDPDIEAVYIPLPNHLHVPWSIRAAEQGKHVLCEKPLALTALEAGELVEVRDRMHVHIAEAFMVRSHPQWLAARHVLKCGEVGALRMITGHFSYFRRDPENVRSNPAWGGGALMDVGCYPITMSRWLFNEEPTEVVGQLEFDPDMLIDRVGSALLRFPSGQAALTFGGQVALSQRMQLFGTRGHITVDVPFSPPPDRESSIVVDDARDVIGGGARTIGFAAVNQYEMQARQFSEAVRGMNDVAVSLEDSINNMRVIDALFESAKTQCWVTVHSGNSVPATDHV